MREANAVDKYIRWSPQTNLFEPVWKQRDILPYWLYPPTDVVNGDIVIGPTSPSILYKLPHSSPGQNDSLGNPLEINEIVYRDTFGNSNSNFTVFVRDMGDRTQFMNAPVHITTFAGTAQLAARLSENLFLPTRHDLLVNFGYNGNDSASIRMYFCGKIYYPWSTNLQNKPIDRDEMIKEINYKLERRKYIYPFWLTTDGGAVDVPANTTLEMDMSIGDDGAFEATHIMSYSNGGLFEIEIYNPQTRQTISNGPFHSTMMGNAQNPQPLPAPFLVPAGEVLRCRVKNLAAITTTVFVTLRGLKCRAKIQSYTEAMAMFGIPIPPKKAKAQKKIDARLTEAVG